MVERFVTYYNHQRLHSAIGFITPADMLAGRAEAIWGARDQKLEAARERRRAEWQQLHRNSSSQNGPGPTITQRVASPVFH